MQCILNFIYNVKYEKCWVYDNNENDIVYN